MPFQFQRLEIPEVILVQPQTFDDHRGTFAETYRRSEFAANGIPAVFVQDNYAFSAQDVLRGLHYQDHPKPQGKLVMVTRGEVFDAAVDIRRGSPTFGRWVGVALSAKNLQALYIPVGFAHGYCVLSEEADIIYKVTEEYRPELDRGILWNDPAIGIHWPVRAPILSPKDARLPLLKDADIKFVYEAAS
jgi:dTDP-4-dehydrorhamnose 3,5-epimerase